MGLFDQLASPTQGCHFGLFPYNSTLYVTFGWDDSEGSTVLQANQWYHIAFVYDCNNQSQHFFLNGIEETVSHPSYSPSAPYRGQCGGITIGKSYQNVMFAGLIDEVSLWDRVRTASEILADATIIG
jgi:hypothetical protein